MFKSLIFLTTGTVFLFIFIGPGKGENKNSNKLSATPSTNHSKMPNISADFAEVMNYCNQSFQIQPEYLIELNDTGSFPDETDKTPMCFLKCYLEKVGIWNKEETVNKDKAVELLWSEADTAIDDCMPEMIGNTDCEKVYYLTRCVMSRYIVDARNQDEKDRN